MTIKAIYCIYCGNTTPHFWDRITRAWVCLRCGH